MSEQVFLPIDLPSKCLPYDADPSDIRVRPYTGEDEIILSQVNLSNLDESYMPILGGIVQGIDPGLLTLGDRLYIMLWGFINSYTSTLPLNYICSHCLKQVESVADLTKIDSIHLPDDYVKVKEIKVGDKVLRVRLMNTGDLVACSKYAKEHSDYHLYQFARMFECDDMDMNAKLVYLKSNIKALAKLRAFDSKYYHGPDMDVPVVCPLESCGKEDVISVPFRLDFIHPSGEFLSEAFGEGI